MRLSKLMDSLNFSIIGSVPPLNLPPAPNRPPRDPDGNDDDDDDDDEEEEEEEEEDASSDIVFAGNISKIMLRFVFATISRGV